MRLSTTESLLAVQKLQQDTLKAQESGNPVKLAQYQEKTEASAIKELKKDDTSDGSDFGASDDLSDDLTGDSTEDTPTLEDYTSWTGYSQELNSAQKFIQTPPARVSYDDLSGLESIGIEQGFGQYDQIPDSTKYLFSKMGKMLSDALYVSVQSKQAFETQSSQAYSTLQETAEKLKAIVAQGDDRQILVTSKQALQSLSINGRYDPSNIRVFNGLFTNLFNTFNVRLMDENNKFTAFAQKPIDIIEFLKIDPKSFNMQPCGDTEGDKIKYLFSDDTVGDIRFRLQVPMNGTDNLLTVLDNYKRAQFSYGYPRSMFTGEVYVNAYELLELINSSCKLSIQIKAFSEQLNNAIDIDGSVSYLVKQLFLDIGPQSEFESRRNELVLAYFLKLSWMFGVLFSAQITLLRVAQNVLSQAVALVTQETSKFF